MWQNLRTHSSCLFLFLANEATPSTGNIISHKKEFTLASWIYLFNWHKLDTKWASFLSFLTISAISYYHHSDAIAAYQKIFEIFCHFLRGSFVTRQPKRECQRGNIKPKMRKFMTTWNKFCVCLLQYLFALTYIFRQAFKLPSPFF